MFSENEKKIIIGLLVSFLLCAVFCQLASPQSYMVTESQLQELEANYQNLRTNNLLLQSQVQKLNTKSETLNEQLKKERDISMSLGKSCAELDVRLSKMKADHAETLQQLNDEKLKCEKQKRKALIFIVASAAEFIILILCVIFLLRRRG